MDTNFPTITKKYAKMYYLQKIWDSIRHIPDNALNKEYIDGNIKLFSNKEIKIIQVKNSDEDVQSVDSKSTPEICYVQSVDLDKYGKIKVLYIVGDIETVKKRMTTFVKFPRTHIKVFPWTTEELLDVQNIFDKSEDNSFSTKVVIKYQKKVFDLLLSKKITLKPGDVININPESDELGFEDYSSLQKYFIYDKIDGVEILRGMYDESNPSVPEHFKIFSDRFHPTYFDQLPFYYNWDCYFDSSMLDKIDVESFEYPHLWALDRSPPHPIKIGSKEFTCDEDVWIDVACHGERLNLWGYGYNRHSFSYTKKPVTIQGKKYLIVRQDSSKSMSFTKKARIINQDYLSTKFGSEAGYHFVTKCFCSNFKKIYQSFKNVENLSNEELVKLIDGDIIVLS